MLYKEDVLLLGDRMMPQ